jgi:cytochrome c peroxidase
MKLRSALPGFSLAVAAATFGFSVAFAQPAGPAPGFRNLQVFPKTISRDELMSNMKFFAQSLGVRCTHCHVGEEGKPATFDFASDAKQEKGTARKMLAMVHRINEQEFGITDFKNVKVTCFTCHRGATKPSTVPPATEGAPQPSNGKPERG